MQSVVNLFKFTILILFVLSCRNNSNKLIIKTISYYPNKNPESKIIVWKGDTIRQLNYDKNGRIFETYFYKYDSIHPFGLTYKYYKYYNTGQIHNLVYLKNQKPIKETIFFPDGRIQEIIGYIDGIRYLETLYFYDTVQYGNIELKKVISYRRKKGMIFSKINNVLIFNDNRIDTNNSSGYIIEGPDTIQIGQSYNFKVKVLYENFIDSAFTEIVIGKVQDTSFRFVDTIWANSGWRKVFNISLKDSFDLGYNYFTGVFKTVSFDSSFQTKRQIYYDSTYFLHDFFVVKKSSNSMSKREIAIQSIKNYMQKKYDNYVPISFGEFFEQTTPEEVQEVLKTKIPIKYSIVHTYSIGNKRINNEYFQLDKNLKVVGHLSYNQVGDIVLKQLTNSKEFQKIVNEK